jgi:hypothetical protein
MIYRALLVTISIYALAACTTEQAKQAAYSSLESKECHDKTGGQSCDLDERTTDQKLMNGAPGALTNEEMEKEALKIHKKNQ